MHKFNCFTGMHEWTSANEQGIEATPEQLNAGVVGFFEYAKMYCKHCGKVSDISQKHLEELKKDN